MKCKVYSVAGMILLTLSACTTPPVNPPKDNCPTPAQPATTPTVMNPQEGEQALDQLAEESTQKLKFQTFEQFIQSVYKEPFVDGKYIVNGDTTIADEKQLREFFDSMMDARPIDRPTLEQSNSADRLAVKTDFYGRDVVWNNIDKKKLTYCVSSGFTAYYQQVVNAMQAATQAWQTVSNVRFIHDTTQDNNCNSHNNNVVFDVNPVHVNGQYLARAFFPDDTRTYRNVLIDASSFKLSPTDKLTLTGILRHELGHVLGFRHEHTRPEAGKCFEDSQWRGVTNYDAFSVMHYPQCNGKGDWTLSLTNLDKQGAASIYGVPNSLPEPLPVGVKVIKKFVSQYVARSKEKNYGSFPVVPNSVFTVNMTGNRNAGDPDLYVGFGAPPSQQFYACRPFLTGANERCSVNVPVNSFGQAFIMVRGFTAGSYNLTVEYVSPR